MGCAHANSQLEQPQPEPNRQNFHPNIGRLTLKILQLNLATNNSSHVQHTYDHIKFQMQSQSFVSFLHHNFGHKLNVTVEPSSFQLSVNTFGKRRKLQVELFSNQQLRCLKRLAVSSFDLSSIFQEHQSSKILTSTSFKQSQKTFDIKLVNVQGDQVSSLSLLTKFAPQPYEILTIKVNSITLRNYSLKKRRIYFRIQVGQETFQSTSALQDKSQIPTWSNSFHTFMIPVSLKEGKISVFEKKNKKGNDLVGQLRLNLKTMLTDEKLQSYCEELILKSQITGTIKLQTLKSISPNDVQKIIINEPTKITLQKQPVQSGENLNIQINSINSFRKTIENEPTTNFDSSRSRDFSSGRIGRDTKLSIKSSNIYRRNHIVLPAIQSGPLSVRQKDYRSWLNQNLKEEKIMKKFKQKSAIAQTKNWYEQKKQFSLEKQEAGDQEALGILRTESHLIQKTLSKPVETKQYEFQESAELPSLNSFFIKLTQDVQTIDLHQAYQQNQINERKTPTQRKAIRGFSRNSTRKLNQPIVELNQKLITLENDLESRPLTPYMTQKNSKPFIKVQSEFVEFDLSLKDQSNHSQNQNPNKIPTLDIFDPIFDEEKPHQKQNFRQKEARKVNVIKQLGKLTEDEFFIDQKSKIPNFQIWQQQINTNPQIQPQM